MLRDLVSVALAIVIVWHETVETEHADPALLTLAAVLLGVPFVARARS